MDPSEARLQRAALVPCPLAEAGAAGPAQHAAHDPDRRVHRRHRDGVVGGELRLPRDPQAHRTVLPGERYVRQTPPETWRQYAPLFRRHSTATITPELLAALAQVEASGDPVARTYWRWRMAWNPFEVYSPASSAVGLYQITDPTFREATRYCVRNHVVREDDCWFRSLYTRVLPSHAVEVTSALLDRDVARTLERQRIVTATPRHKQDLAAIIHLCGPAQATSSPGAASAWPRTNNAATTTWPAISRA